MNVMFKQAIEFAKNLEGSARAEQIQEMGRLIKLIHSEAENTAKVEYPENHYLKMYCDYEAMTIELLNAILFMKSDFNLRVKLAIDNLKQ